MVTFEVRRVGVREVPASLSSTGWKPLYSVYGPDGRAIITGESFRVVDSLRDALLDGVGPCSETMETADVLVAAAERDGYRGAVAVNWCGFLRAGVRRV